MGFWDSFSLITSLEASQRIRVGCVFSYDLDPATGFGFPVGTTKTAWQFLQKQTDTHILRHTPTLLAGAQ